MKGQAQVLLIIAGTLIAFAGVSMYALNNVMTVNGTTVYINGSLNVSGNITGTGMSGSCTGYRLDEIDNGTHVFYDLSTWEGTILEC